MRLVWSEFPDRYKSWTVVLAQKNAKSEPQIKDRACEYIGRHMDKTKIIQSRDRPTKTIQKYSSPNINSMNTIEQNKNILIDYIYVKCTLIYTISKYCNQISNMTDKHSRSIMQSMGQTVDPFH